MSEEKNGLLKQQAARFLAWMVGIVGTALVVPQDLIVKEGLPALKDAVATSTTRANPRSARNGSRGRIGWGSTGGRSSSPRSSA